MYIWIVRIFQRKTMDKKWINEWVVFFDFNFNIVVMMQESRAFQEDGKLEFLVSSS